MSDDPRADLDAALGDLNDAQLATLLGWARTLHRQPGAYEGHPSVGPLGDLLGIAREEMGGGKARLRLDVNPAWSNPNGVLHGGVIYTLVDYSMGGAVQNSLPAGDYCATIEIKITYMAPVREGVLIAETEVVRQGRSIAFTEARVRDEVGRLVATASGSMFIFRASPPD